ncbi:MAG: NAD-dependent isocitrate dehydrogenase, partial [Methanobrevibacter sp.]|nr:NAD-dependent isocitrate dehydrogenase [Candidatus Methanoflexus mossambicus]
MYKIAIIPGDGIGKEVMEATLHVLDALDIDLEYEFGEAGDECKEKTGEALPKETIDLVKRAD